MADGHKTGRFSMAKLFPVDTESAVAELYYDEMIWAYVSLAGIDPEAVGDSRVKDAQVVVEFWREPDKPIGAWDFSLDLDEALRWLTDAKAWLIENETGRSAAPPNLSRAGQALSKMSNTEQKQFGASDGDEQPR